MPIRSLRTIVAKQKPITAPKSATVLRSLAHDEAAQHRRAARRRRHASGRHLHRARRAVPRAGRRARRDADAASRT